MLHFSICEKKINIKPSVKFPLKKEITNYLSSLRELTSSDILTSSLLQLLLLLHNFPRISEIQSKKIFYRPSYNSNIINGFKYSVLACKMHARYCKVLEVFEQHSILSHSSDASN